MADYIDYWYERGTAKSDCCEFPIVHAVTFRDEDDHYEENEMYCSLCSHLCDSEEYQRGGTVHV